MNNEFTYNGIKIYKGDETSPGLSYCSVLDLKFDCICINQGWVTTNIYSKISVLIFDKLGFDLSTKDGYKISKEAINRNKVVCVWNNMVNEFNDVETMTKKLKETSVEFKC